MEDLWNIPLLMIDADRANGHCSRRTAEYPCPRGDRSVPTTRAKIISQNRTLIYVRDVFLCNNIACTIDQICCQTIELRFTTDDQLSSRTKRSLGRTYSQLSPNIYQPRTIFWRTTGDDQCVLTPRPQELPPLPLSSSYELEYRYFHSSSSIYSGRWSSNIDFSSLV